MRRLSIAVAAAASIAAAAPAPALADPPPSERAYVCEYGSRYFNSWTSSWNVTGITCTGPTGGTGSATITLLTGHHPSPATFTCRYVAFHSGWAIGSFC
ncbi:hypothetical protein ACIBKY_44480 [Nonomuraea sp. NPDC050394]|uniref:hypothetical protein n=1 Tax=Nonomuraea sp. NPDC050394 TaxID=3364363 RepID=UPI0037AC9E74